MFGRATITLGIGPHSSYINNQSAKNELRVDGKSEDLGNIARVTIFGANLDDGGKDIAALCRTVDPLTTLKEWPFYPV